MILKRLYTPVLVALAFALYACDGGNSPARDAATQTLAEAVTLPNGLVLPAGTTLRDAKTRDGKPSIAFKLPEGYRLIGLKAQAESDPASDAEEMEEGTITCSCPSGGCSPFRARRGREVRVGCASTGCQGTCTMTVDATGDRDPLFDAAIIDMNRPIEMPISRAEDSALACPPPALLRAPSVRRALADFVDPLQRTDAAAARAAVDEASLPADYRMANVDLFGYLVRVPVQDGTSLSLFVRSVLVGHEDGVKNADEEVLEEGPARCVCRSGNVGCALQRASLPGVGSIEYCNAGRCSRCFLVT